MSRRTSRDPIKRRIGRRTILTEEKADVILHAVERGNHIVTACALAHVGRSTLYAWLERADNVERAAGQGLPYDRDHLIYVDFRDRLAEARALAEVRAVDVVERSMAGGFLISEKVQVDGEGKPIRDDDGKLVYERVYSQPDGRLALSYLGRSRPDVWGQNPTQRIEIHGPAADDDGDDGPDPDTIGRLAERLAITARQAEDEDPEGYGVQPDADGVYPAELVEEQA